MKQTAVIGGGAMGAGIAHALLLAGARVRLVEVTADAAEAAGKRVAGLVAKTEARGSLTKPAGAVLERLSTHTGLDAVAGSELLVEAVPEDPKLKVRVLGDAEAHVGPDCLVGTNTSSISVDELAAALGRPDRFLGMHFFNPVPASQLVELVRGAATAPAAVERARGWVEALGKTPIVVADSPGFASSRLGLALGLEAIRMVQDGVASAEDIDAAMTLGYKHPVGPLRLTDLVGLDVRLAIAQYLHERLGERFAPPALLVEKVARGELGRKSGRGFHGW